MLSRRNVRVKVMQVLYALSKDEAATEKHGKQYYNDSIERSFDLYLLNLNHLVSSTEFVLEDAKRRKEKHLPTEEDKNFSIRLYNNPIIKHIANNDAFLEAIRKRKLKISANDKDINRKYYYEFAKTPEFKAFMALDSIDFTSSKDVLLHFYKSLTKSELFNEQMEDYSPTWLDDKSLVIGAIKKTLKNPEPQADFFNAYFPDKETVEEFGSELLHKCIKADKELFEIIEPKLTNWDADRVAAIDMLLLKMAVCELIYFPSIPTKVTINEFVDISKIYSTPKSKEFINGILDKLMKLLEKEGRIKKKGRGLID